MRKKLESFTPRSILSAHNQTKMCIAQGCSAHRVGETKYCITHGRAAAKRLERTAQVYFIMAPGTGHVKIGFSKNVPKRLRQLQGANPRKLILVGAVDLHQKYERMIHDCLRRHRVQGEWFELADEVVEFMQVALEEGLAGVRRLIKAAGVAPWLFEDPANYKKGAA